MLQPKYSLKFQPFEALVTFLCLYLLHHLKHSVFLSDFPYIFIEGVNVIPNSTVEHVSFKDNQVNLRLNSGEEVRYWYLYFALMLKEKARVLTIYANHLLEILHVNKST